LLLLLLLLLLLRVLGFACLDLERLDLDLLTFLDFGFDFGFDAEKNILIL
jgi:hypothetical protein